MTTFAEIIGNVEKKNNLQRQVLAQSIQPFFAAMQAQANYKEQKKRADAEMAQRNDDYYNANKTLADGGEANATMPIAVQAQYFQEKSTLKAHGNALKDKSQQLGLGTEYEKYLAQYGDADVAYGKVLQLVDDKTIDENAMELGTGAYATYAEYSKTMPKSVALSRVTKEKAYSDTEASNIAYNTAMQNFYNTGEIPMNATPEMTKEMFKIRKVEQDRINSLIKELKGGEVWDDLSNLRDKYPDMSVDELHSIGMKLMGANKIDELAKSLADEGYKYYLDDFEETNDRQLSYSNAKKYVKDLENKAKLKEEEDIRKQKFSEQVYLNQVKTPEPKPATPTQVANTTTDLEKARFELRQYEKSGYTEGNGDKALTVKINGSSAKYSNGWSEKDGVWYDQNGKAVKPNKNGEYDEKVSPIIKSMVALRNKAQSYNDKLRFNIKQAKTKQNIVAPVDGNGVDVSVVDDLLGDY